MTNEIFPEPTSWNGDDQRWSEPGMEVDPRDEEPDVKGMADDYETRKHEALDLALHAMGSEDAKACVEALWLAIYSDYMEPSDSIWATLQAWGIEWSQLKIKP
jgi:hypothetical protein